MATRTQTTAGKAVRSSRPRHATKADIEHLTNSIDRIRDDHTRYLVCMTLDIITQHLADQAKEEEEGASEVQPVAN